MSRWSVRQNISLNQWLGWGLVIIGMVSVTRSGFSVWNLYKSGEKLESAKEELRLAEEENKTLRVRLDEVQSAEFVEKEAREKLGYAMAGEQIVIMPRSDQEEKEREKERSEEIPNWEKWWDLYVRL